MTFTANDTTSHKPMEQGRLVHLRFLESMDRVNQAIQGTNDLEQMMSDVLDAVLSIFDCDRAFLTYPCDPEADSWQVPMERTTPDYPGALALGFVVPMDTVAATTFHILRNSSCPVKFGPGNPYPLEPEVAERLSIKSFMSMTLYPKVGHPWQFGIHQCAYPRVWTAEEERLLQEIGQRLADGLTSLLMFRNLQESEHKLAEAQRVAHIGHWDFDLDADCITGSDETHRIFGQPLDTPSLTLAQFLDLIHPADRQMIAKDVKSALQGTSSSEGEYRVLRSDGEVRFVYFQWNQTKSRPGQPLRLFGIVQDITARRRAEEERRTTERQLLTLMENYPDSIARFDREGRYLYVNPAIEEKFGRPPEYFLGKTFHELPNTGPVGQNDALHNGIKQVFEEGQSIILEACWPTSQNDRIFEVRLIPELDESDQVISVLGITRDITERRYAEDELRASEERYRALYRDNPSMFFTLDREGTVISVNEYGARQLGYTIDELEGQSVLNVFYEDDKGMVVEKLQECLQNPWQVYPWQFRKVRRDGSLLWVEEFARAVTGSDGTLQVLIVCQDITERKQAEQALRLNNFALERTSDAVYWINSTTIVDVNEAACRMLGYSRDEFIGMPVMHIDPLVPVSEIVTIWEQIKQVGSLTFETQHKTKDGRIVPVEVMTNYIAFEGQELNCCFVRDITERKHAEEALVTERALLRAVIEAAPMAIIGLDLDGYVQFVWNSAAEKMLGWSAEEVMGHFLPSVPDDNQEGFKQFREQIRRGENLNGVEVRRQRRDGTLIDYSIYTSTLHNVEGHINGNIAVLVDITERNRVQSITQARLRLLEFANSHSMDELLTATLDEIEALTGSTIGFYHLLESDQKTLLLQSWSTNTLKNMCMAEGKGRHYNIAQAGVWVDCVHERHPVIHNDYASLPHRKGMPDGHVLVTREVVVPIFRGSQIKAILGMGNKSTPYTESDIEIVFQLGDLSWDIVERKRAEEALIAERTLLRTVIDNLPDYIYAKDAEGRYILKNLAERHRMEVASPDEVIGKTDFDCYPSELAERYHADDQVVLQSGHPLINREEPVIAADGTQSWLLTSKVPLRDTQEIVVGLVGIGRDITERKQAEEAEQRRRRIAETLVNAAAVLNSTLDLDQVLDRILQQLRRAIDYDSASFLEMKDDYLVISVCQGFSQPHDVLGIRFSLDSDQPSGRVITEKVPLHLVDVSQKYPHFRDKTDPPHHIHTWLGVPVLSKEHVIGVITLARFEKRPFTDEDIELVTTFANQSAIAIENARLHKQTQRHAEELEQRVEERTMDLQQEIIERKRAEESLRVSETRHRIITELMSDYVYSVIINHANDTSKAGWISGAVERITGYTAEEIRALPGGWNAIVHPDEIADFALIWPKLLSGQAVVHEYRITTKSGEVRWLRDYKKPVWNEMTERVPLIWGAVQDITERKQAEEVLCERTMQLEAANEELRILSRVKDEFVSNVSHELRTPITNLKLRQHLLAAHPDNWKKHLDVISRETQRLQHIIESLLYLSRLDQDRVGWHPTRVDLTQLTSQFVRDRMALAQSRELTLFFTGEPNLPFVKADMALWEQALSILLTNAFNYTPAGGHIEVKTQACERDGQRWAGVSVSDTGPGISPDEQAYLFERFFRGTAGRESGAPGTGLGLSIVQEIVNKHRGRVEVVSEGVPGEGATFSLWLLAARAASKRVSS